MATPCGPAPVTRSGDWEAAAGRRRWSTGAGTPGADWRRPHEQPTAEQARRACGDWEAAAHAGTGGRPSRRPAPPSTAPPIRLVLLQFRLSTHLALLQLQLAPPPLVLLHLPLAPPSLVLLQLQLAPPAPALARPFACLAGTIDAALAGETRRQRDAALAGETRRRRDGAPAWKARWRDIPAWEHGRVGPEALKWDGEHHKLGKDA